MDDLLHFVTSIPVTCNFQKSLSIYAINNEDITQVVIRYTVFTVDFRRLANLAVYDVTCPRDQIKNKLY